MPNNPLQPCPYCGSKNLTTNYWSVEDSEKEAVECTKCLGSNLRDHWNNRSNTLQLNSRKGASIYSLCPGVVTKTNREEIEITTDRNQKYRYKRITPTVEIDQIIESCQHIGFCDNDQHIQLQVSER